MAKTGLLPSEVTAFRHRQLRRACLHHAGTSKRGTSETFPKGSGFEACSHSFSNSWVPKATGLDAVRPTLCRCRGPGGGLGLGTAEASCSDDVWVRGVSRKPTSVSESRSSFRHSTRCLSQTRSLEASLFRFEEAGSFRSESLHVTVASAAYPLLQLLPLPLRRPASQRFLRMDGEMAALRQALDTEARRPLC